MNKRRALFEDGKYRNVYYSKTADSWYYIKRSRRIYGTLENKPAISKTSIFVQLMPC